jgi:hypothetical protein
MTDDLKTLNAIANLANGKLVGGELEFTYPEVLEAIRLCTANRIAVLGIEAFEIKEDRYHTIALTGYEFQMHEWDQFVKENNASAEEFIRQNPAGDGHLFVLTTTSRGEFPRIPPE